MMKGKRHLLPLLSLLTLVLMLGACGGGNSGKTGGSGTTAKPPAGTTGGKPKDYVTVSENGASYYTLVIPSSNTAVADVSGFAMSMRDILGIQTTPVNDRSAETAAEVLIGETARAASVAVKERLDALHTEDAFRYVIAESGGKIIILADDAHGYSYALSRIEKVYLVNGTVKVEKNAFDVQTVTWEQYQDDLDEQERLKQEEEARKLAAKIAVIKGKISAYTLSDFGKITKLSSSYEKPEVYPTKSEHPRVLFREQDLTTIRKNLSEKENAFAYAQYLKLADNTTDGTLPAPTAKTYNMDYNILAAIEAKAFRYALTGEELYGYQAILGILNYMKSLVITSDLSDNCRAYGYTMYIAACVYDWCYALTDATVRAQIVAGCETLLAPYFEVGFPPSGQGAITGHGTEAQVLRDWLSLAIATYDEYPDIYEFVAGRLFDQYREEQEFYLASGSHWQGSAYGPYRYYFLLYTEALFERMTGGTFKFFSENLALPARTFIHYIRPDNQALRIGDDFNEGGSVYGLNGYSISAFYAGTLYHDPICKGFAYTGLNSFSQFNVSNNALSSVMFLALNNPSIERDSVSKLPLVSYNGSPLGSIIARSSWAADAAMVYMKVGEAYSANHEHKDAGVFQIYYHGILASDSGFYDSYGTPHDYAYNKQTISSNCLLIYNPTLPNNGKWINSGGQNIHGTANNENGSLATWLSKQTSRQASILGYDYAVRDCAEGGEEYLCSYLAGDLTSAYDASTVDEVSRYMLSVMTGNETHPMLFVVYDRITSQNADYKKTFLLHVQQEPTVSGQSAVVVNTKGNNHGKLTVQSLLADVTYTVIGGEGQEYVVNGENYPLNRVMDANSIHEAGWGRIEISPAAPALTDRLLTVMYVGDSSDTAALIPAAEITGDSVVGAILFGKVAVFPKEAGSLSTEFTLTAAGDGSLDYYIAGISAGQWDVSVGGTKVGRYEVAEGKNLLNFTAPAGTVTLTPAFSTVQYALNGGKAGTALPTKYSYGTTTVLPTDLTKLGSEFVGWYTTPDFAEGTGMTEIGTSSVGAVMLYAKWNKLFDVIHYEIGDGQIEGSYSNEHRTGETYTLPTTVTCEGKLFAGWYTTPDFAEENRITVLAADLPEGDVTVYARYISVHANLDMDRAKPSGVGLSFEDGWLVWSNTNPTDGSQISAFTNEYHDSTLTVSFDICAPEGTTPLNWVARLRPSERNVVDTEFITMSNGQLKIGRMTDPILTVSAEPHRVTIVLKNDNAGLASGKAAPAGTVTTGNAYSSNLLITAYVDGIYAGETTVTTYLTMGDGFVYSNGTKSFPSNVAMVQFYSGAAAAGESKIRLDNLLLADGALTLGGVCFLHTNGGTPTNGSYFSGGVVVSLPTLEMADAIFSGWYLTPDFTGEPVTTPEGLANGTLLYAKWVSEYERILYVTNGATIEGEYPVRRSHGEAVTLPTAVMKEYSTFLGWYTTPGFEEGTRIDSIPAELAGDVTVYARFSTVQYDMKFDGTDMKANQGLANNFNATDKVGGQNVSAQVEWVAPSEENGQNGYLIAKNDGSNGVQGQYINFMGMNMSGESITVSFDIKMDTFGSTQWRIRLRGPSSGESWIWGITSNGTMYCANSTSKTIGNAVHDGWVTVSIHVTFSGDGNLTEEVTVDGVLIRTETMSTFADSVSDIARMQFYSSATVLDGQCPNTYLDNVKITCQ